MANPIALIRALTNPLLGLSQTRNGHGTSPYRIDVGLMRIHVTPGLTRLIYRIVRSGRPNRVPLLRVACANWRAGQ